MPDLQDNPRPTKLAASAVTPSRFTSWRDHFAAERRWMADTFSREKMVDMLKQLAWVVPLTLLIWVYAEREQVTKETNETIPFEIVSSDATRIVTLKAPDSNVVVELEGPRARVQDVLQRLNSGEFPQGLRVEVDRALEANRDHQIRTLSLIANHDLFRRNGISVTRAQPDTINVTIDELVEREAIVEAAPGTPNLLEGTKFDPPAVKVTGPRNMLVPEGDTGDQPLVAYAHVPAHLVASQGTREADDLRVSLPPAIAKDNRVKVTPVTVGALLQVRASDAEWVMPAMAISLDQPRSVADQFTVDYPTSLPGVTLIGPKDVIDAMQKPDGPKPYAQLKVTLDDKGRGEQTRTLRFVDLPDRVRVSEKDKVREVRFTLKPRSEIGQ